jgi:hypothetical protein
LIAGHPKSTFSVVLSNLFEPHTTSHSFDLLSEVIRIMKPCGIVCGKELTDLRISSNLKLAGFHNVTVDSTNSIFSAQTPNFEVGTSSRLSFAKPTIWTLSDALVDDQVELINEDDLLDESDLIKPAAESLRGNFLFG